MAFENTRTPNANPHPAPYSQPTCPTGTARGVFGSVFCPPAAPEGRSFVRFTVHCAMSDAQCEHFLEVMEAARRVLGDALHAEPAEARPRAPEVQEFWGP